MQKEKEQIVYHGIYSYTYYYNGVGASGPWNNDNGNITSDNEHSKPFGPNAAGTHLWLKVLVTDKAGNETFSNVYDAWTKVNAPVVTILNNNIWTRSKKVQIQGIPNHSIRYTGNGIDPTATTGTEITGTGTKEIEIWDNLWVKAVYVNTVTGQVNSAVGAANTTKIDKTPPTIATLTVGTKTSTEINVTATGADAAGGSGIHMYVYEVSTTSPTAGFTTVGTTSSAGNTPLPGTDSYKITGLSPNTTYYVRVCVVDFALNELYSTPAITVKTLLPKQ